MTEPIVNRKDQSRLLWDIGLVGTVIGGAATFLMGLITLGMGAVTGRVSLFLGLVLGLTTSITMVCLVITLIGIKARRPRTQDLPPSD
ncbi:MAG: hypothetical protein F4Y75_03785 [Acidimicrobiia bacterium]|nr:hypothetical protein [bacterium]MXX64365.1 hypothetical protein [Acidimicrobiia bacterium]MCY3579047.1 hypothetical protein [bacterium]MCY3652657.1 hypothetical protein [bacterium]MDE0642988.1 hypothetical protein [bacterium]